MQGGYIGGGRVEYRDILRILLGWVRGSCGTEDEGESR